MQRQHQQLHTHEKILRYELGQKRKMLTELKQELEYCREKWEQAREKNSTTEEEWKKLRTEFASRKTAVTDDLSNSAESGYSDEQEGSSDEESEKQNKTSASNKIINASDSDDDKKDTTGSEATQATSIHCPGERNDTPSVKQKTEVEVQNVIRKTQPASLDMIDDVCALAISPVVIVNDVFTSQFIEATKGASASNQMEVDNVPSSKLDAVEDATITTTNSVEIADVKGINKSTEHINDIVLDDSLSGSTNNVNEETSTLESTTLKEEIPSTSSSTETETATASTSIRELTQDERLQRREERLRRLEEQCKQLVTKVANTNSRSTEIHNRLDALHEQYGNDSPRVNAPAPDENHSNTTNNQSNEETTNDDTSK